MGIFRQMGPFSKVLLIWRVKVGMLVVYEASCKTCDNLRG